MLTNKTFPTTSHPIKTTCIVEWRRGIPGRRQVVSFPPALTNLSVLLPLECSNRHHLQTKTSSNGRSNPVWVPGLRIDPLHLLAGCRKRRLNQTPLGLRPPWPHRITDNGLEWKREHSEEGPLMGTLPQELSSLQLTSEPVMVQRKKKPTEVPGENRKKHHITVRDLLRFLTSSQRFW